MASPDLLPAAGRALYGRRWQTGVAQLLQVDRQTVRRWWRGEYPVPDDARRRLAAALRERSGEAAALACALEQGAATRLPPDPSARA